VFFKVSLEIGGGKEQAAKLGKSLNYCKKVAGGRESIIFFP